jgi:DNA-binding transcriptional MerR regulator
MEKGYRRLDKKTLVERNRLIFRLKAQGLTAKQIASQVRLRPSQVWLILSEGSDGAREGKARKGTSQTPN